MTKGGAGVRRQHRGSLAGQFDPKRNSLNALRLLFATMVVIWHSQAIGFYGRSHGEIGSLWGSELAVDGFFVISGFLITRSRVTTTHGRDFLRKRFLRLYPGYWACLLIGGFVVAPLVYHHDHHGLSGFNWLGNGGAATYIVSNATLFVHQYGVSGVLGHAPVPGSVNGSIWTLMYEFGCYLAVAALAWVGLLRRHSRLIPAGGIVCLLGVVWHTVDATGFDRAVHSPIVVPSVVRFGLMFAIGASAYLWADRIPMSHRLALTAAAVFAASVALPNWRLTGALPLAYLILWASIHLPLHRVGSKVDLSYGIYLYAWPVQVLLFAWGASRWGLPAFIIMSVAGAAACAYLSWTLVEQPTLRLKRREAASPAAVPSIVLAAIAAPHLTRWRREIDLARD